jgi:hypothetical protein
VRLIVEHEHVRGCSALRVGCRFVHFDRAHFEKRLAESLIDRDEGRSQTAGAFEKLTAANPQLLRGGVGQFLDPKLDVLLLFCLRMRHILAVGDHPGRNRGLKRFILRRCALAKLFIAEPCILFAGAGKSLWVRHRFSSIDFLVPLPFAF